MIEKSKPGSLSPSNLGIFSERGYVAAIMGRSSTRKVRLSSLRVILCLSAASIANGQSTNASLSGAVRDVSGGLVPGAELVLTSQQTQTEARFTTGKDGLYRFANLQAGAYTLSVNAKGFEQFTQQGIVLALNDTTTLNVTLSVGGAVEKVEVNAAASPINHEDAEHKGEISQVTLGEVKVRKVRRRSEIRRGKAEVASQVNVDHR